MDSTKVGVILPIHEYNEEVRKLVERAVKSVPDEYFLLVVDGTNGEENEFEFVLNFHPNSFIDRVVKDGVIKTSNFSELVNYGMVALKETKEWAYLLEFDDEFNELWFNETVREVADKPDVSVFLPLTELLDYETGKFVSYGNEAPWASSFSNEIGYIDNESLKQFFDFYLTGSLFNLRDWTYVGGLKESFKLTFWYEFLLRLTHNDKKAYVIPKLGYKHYVNRPNSLYMKYKEGINEEESKWWYNLALEEYTYKKDRKKTYKK